MKRKLSVTVALILTVVMTACGNSGTTKTATTQPETTAQTTVSAEPLEPAEQTGAGSNTGDRILIAYFSMPETDGTNTVAGASRVVVDGTLYGNTEYLANLIQERTDGTLFSIETVEEYPGLHEPLVDQAAEEQDADARPELAALAENLADYDVIFLGYPNWWGDLPMPLYTFLDTHDLSGKTIIPFNSHGGSRLSGTIATIQQMQPGAEVITDGYTISRDTVGNAGSSMDEWLDGLGY